MAFYDCKEGSSSAGANRRWHEKSRISKAGSHRQLQNANFDYEFTWAFHDGDEIGPKMLAKIAKRTGLKPKDL
jgi:predicted RNA binding protein YcfA (HicA-like mRNA interferase family)